MSVEHDDARSSGVAERAGLRSRRGRLGVVFAVVAVLGLGLVPGSADAAEPGVITGRVTDSSGAPVGPESGICATPTGYSQNSWSNLESDGTYRLENIDPGNWGVTFTQCATNRTGVHYAPQMYPNMHEPIAATNAELERMMRTVVVRPGAVTTGIDARLQPGGTISVDVVDRSGSPRRGLCVSTSARPRSVTGPGVGGMGGGASGETDAAGRVVLSGLAPGSFWVRVYACQNGVLSDPDLARFQYSNGVFQEHQAAVYRVELSGAATVGVVMVPGAELSGTVTADGEPVADRCVRWMVDNDIGGGSSDITTSTDADGRYRFQGLNPTSGRLGACGDPRGPGAPGVTAPLWYPAGAHRRTASPIQLQPGAHRTVDFALRRERTISAVVSRVPAGRNCQVVMTSGAARSVMDLRPGNETGEWFGDLFDHRFAPDWNVRNFELHCDGRRSGVARPNPYPNFSADFPTSTEEQNWPVLYFMFDETGPVITPSVNAATMAWTRSPVTVSFRCQDAGIGVRTCPTPVRFTEGHVATVSARDEDGNITSRRVGPLRIDATPPRVAVANRQRTFRTSEVVSLGCSVRDDRSGLRSQTNQCPAAGTKASALGVGEHKFSIVGTDHAGNSVWEIVTVQIVK